MCTSVSLFVLSCSIYLHYQVDSWLNNADKHNTIPCLWIILIKYTVIELTCFLWSWCLVPRALSALPGPGSTVWCLVAPLQTQCWTQPDSLGNHSWSCNTRHISWLRFSDSRQKNQNQRLANKYWICLFEKWQSHLALSSQMFHNSFC